MNVFRCIIDKRNRLLGTEAIIGDILIRTIKSPPNTYPRFGESLEEVLGSIKMAPGDHIIINNMIKERGLKEVKDAIETWCTRLHVAVGLDEPTGQGLVYVFRGEEYIAPRPGRIIINEQRIG